MVSPIRSGQAVSNVNRYVLSPTHIHEFKSADRIYTQPPVMSLYLPDQKLGSRSQPGSSSHKFVIKGRQTGSMHRGHTWVFRAETYETMLAWFDDIKSLTEKSGEERNAFVRRHASVRSTSAGSARSGSSDGGLEEDEADAIPYSANQSVTNQSARDESQQRPSRPSPGGRFPSDLMVNRSLQAPLSPSSGSSEVGNDLTTAAGSLQQNVHPMYSADASSYQPVEPVQPAQYAQPSQQQQGLPASSYVNAYPPTQQPYNGQASYDHAYATPSNAYNTQPHNFDPSPIERQDTDYGNWMAPAAGGAAAGALASGLYHQKQTEQQERAQQQELHENSQLQNQEQQSTEPPRTMGFMDTAPTNVPERHPDHITPDHIDDAGHIAQPTTSDVVSQPKKAPVPIVAPAYNQTQPTVNSGPDTPATTESFLDDSDVGTAVPFGQTINGGRAPVDPAEAAQGMAHPGVVRQNTDISVSELHVPGEYPKVRVDGSRVPMP